MANDFSGDSNCKALYNFESGALTTDSKSTNTLTASANPPTADTTAGQFKQGVSSALFAAASTEYYTRTDTDLAAGFPLKSGDSTKIISVCGWVYLASLPGSGTVYDFVCKYLTTGNLRSFRLFIDNATTPGTVTFGIGFGFASGVSNETHNHGSALSATTLYHVTAYYAGDTNKYYGIMVRDSSGSIVGSDVINAAATLDANGLSVTTADFTIGARASGTNCYDGALDEWVVFNKVISASEATQLSQGLYMTSRTISVSETLSMTETLD